MRGSVRYLIGIRNVLIIAFLGLMFFTLVSGSYISRRDTSDDISDNTVIAPEPNPVPPDSPPKHLVGDFVLLGGVNWRVLDISEEKALVLSEDILFDMAYHDIRRGAPWEESSARRYLNNDFYEMFFTDEEKLLIVPSRVENARNRWTLAEGNEDTIDRIFLLSLDEVLHYFSDGDFHEYEYRDYIGYLTDDHDSLRVAKHNGRPSWWWLRTAGTHHYAAAGIYGNGAIGVGGALASYEKGYGIRPAMWILNN